MKLSQKKNCVNCWALEEGFCNLGTVTNIPFMGESNMAVPMSKCYKPKTKKQFKRALKLMEGSDGK